MQEIEEGRLQVVWLALEGQGRAFCRGGWGSGLGRVGRGPVLQAKVRNSGVLLTDSISQPRKPKLER